MFSRKAAILPALLFALSAAALQRQERVIAGSPSDSIEVRHLVLRGTNEEIGRALAEIAQERYGAHAERASDPLRIRAQRRYIETAFPILADRMRGVAAAFGLRQDDDAWDHSQLAYADLEAGCSIVHLPRQATADGQSVVGRDYDFSTGSLNFGFLEPGKLHPTARPYLVELHPDRGYASIAMVAYDLLSGALDGMNSEGLTVSIAMDDEILEKHKIEPTLGSAPGLAELQTVRLLLDTCANVDEAKEALLRTKQYYQYIPVHYLVADRFGNSFVWEYSEAHNKEYIIENSGQPLVMTNFTMHKYMDGNKPPSADLARSTCRRYAYLADKLAATPAGITETALRQIHSNVDAQTPAAANQKRPPIRTFWHALYYPEQRRVKFSYYLRDDGDRIVRSDYQEFRLETTNAPAPPSIPQPSPQPSPQPPVAARENDVKDAESPVVAKLRAAGATVQIERGEVVAVGFAKNSDPAPLLPLLRELPKLHLVGFAETKITDDSLAQLTALKRIDFVGLRDTAITDAGLAHLSKLTGITGLNLSGTKVTDAGLAHLKTMSHLTKVNVSRTAVTEQGVAEAKKFLPFWATIQR
jgi:acyl-CoA:6-aminopenicillanic acid acyl transferase